MYESPITQILGEMRTEYENGCIRAVQSYGFNVNKEELAKALAYDREQYKKGYEDGLNADKWILCSEKLPKVNEYVLCSGHGKPFIGCIDSLDNEWRDDHFYKRTTVIAWQPLPTPYKPE